MNDLQTPRTNDADLKRPLHDALAAIMDTSPAAPTAPTDPNLLDRYQPANNRRRLLVGSAAAAVLLVGVGGLVYLRGQANELERIEVTGLTPAASLPPISSDPTSSAPIEDVPPIATPLNILVAGVDRRPPGDEVPGSRVDTIAVVRIDPDEQRVSVLSVPRDLWVTTEDGIGRRINSFTDDGGLVDVVSSVLGIDINHYVEVDFAGFQDLIDLAGGVSVPFDTALRDEQSGFTAIAGCNDLSGAGALAYVRSRHMQALDPVAGEWRQDPSSDLGRIARQQDLMQRVLTTVLSHDYSTADKARLLTDVVDDITVDTGLDLTRLQAIFNTAALIGADNFRAYDLNSTLSGEVIDGNAVLVADAAGIQADVDSFLNGSTDHAGPDQITTTDGVITPATAAC
jgi:LCP family protein required for cell wall assembly